MSKKKTSVKEAQGALPLSLCVSEQALRDRPMPYVAQLDTPIAQGMATRLDYVQRAKVAPHLRLKDYHLPEDAWFDAIDFCPRRPKDPVVIPEAPEEFWANTVDFRSATGHVHQMDVRPDVFVEQNTFLNIPPIPSSLSAVARKKWMEDEGAERLCCSNVVNLAAPVEGDILLLGHHTHPYWGGPEQTKDMKILNDQFGVTAFPPYDYNNVTRFSRSSYDQVWPDRMVELTEFEKQTYSPLFRDLASLFEGEQPDETGVYALNKAWETELYHLDLNRQARSKEPHHLEDLRKVYPSRTNVYHEARCRSSIALEIDVNLSPTLDPRVRREVEPDANDLRKRMPVGTRCLNFEELWRPGLPETHPQEHKHICLSCASGFPVMGRDDRAKHTIRCAGLHGIVPLLWCTEVDCSQPLYYTWEAYQMHCISDHLFPGIPFSVYILWRTNQGRQPPKGAFLMCWDQVQKDLFRQYTTPLVTQIAGQGQIQTERTYKHEKVLTPSRPTRSSNRLQTDEPMETDDANLTSPKGSVFKSPRPVVIRPDGRTPSVRDVISYLSRNHKYCLGMSIAVSPPVSGVKQRLPTVGMSEAQRNRFSLIRVLCSEGKGGVNACLNKFQTRGTKCWWNTTWKNYQYAPSHRPWDFTFGRDLTIIHPSINNIQCRRGGKEYERQHVAYAAISPGSFSSVTSGDSADSRQEDPMSPESTGSNLTDPLSVNTSPSQMDHSETETITDFSDSGVGDPPQPTTSITEGLSPASVSTPFVTTSIYAPHITTSPMGILQIAPPYTVDFPVSFGGPRRRSESKSLDSSSSQGSSVDPALISPGIITSTPLTHHVGPSSRGMMELERLVDVMALPSTTPDDLTREAQRLSECQFESPNSSVFPSPKEDERKSIKRNSVGETSPASVTSSKSRRSSEDSVCSYQSCAEDRIRLAEVSRDLSNERQQRQTLENQLQNALSNAKAQNLSISKAKQELAHKTTEVADLQVLLQRANNFKDSKYLDSQRRIADLGTELATLKLQRKQCEENHLKGLEDANRIQSSNQRTEEKYARTASDISDRDYTIRQNRIYIQRLEQDAAATADSLIESNHKLDESRLKLETTTKELVLAKDQSEEYANKFYLTRHFCRLAVSLVHSWREYDDIPKSLTSLYDEVLVPVGEYIKLTPDQDDPEILSDNYRDQLDNMLPGPVSKPPSMESILKTLEKKPLPVITATSSYLSIPPGDSKCGPAMDYEGNQKISVTTAITTPAAGALSTIALRQPGEAPKPVITLPTKIKIPCTEFEFSPQKDEQLRRALLKKHDKIRERGTKLAHPAYGDGRPLVRAREEWLDPNYPFPKFIFGLLGYGFRGKLGKAVEDVLETILIPTHSIEEAQAQFDIFAKTPETLFIAWCVSQYYDCPMPNGWAGRMQFKVANMVEMLNTYLDLPCDQTGIRPWTFRKFLVRVPGDDDPVTENHVRDQSQQTMRMACIDIERHMDARYKGNRKIDLEKSLLQFIGECGNTSITVVKNPFKKTYKTRSQRIAENIPFTEAIQTSFLASENPELPFPSSPEVVKAWEEQITEPESGSISVSTPHHNVLATPPRENPLTLLEAAYGLDKKTYTITSTKEEASVTASGEPMDAIGFGHLKLTDSATKVDESTTPRLPGASVETALEISDSSDPSFQDNNGNVVLKMKNVKKRSRIVPTATSKHSQDRKSGPHSDTQVKNQSNLSGRSETNSRSKSRSKAKKQKGSKSRDRT